MRKALLTLLISSLCLGLTRLMAAQENLLALTTNFRPANPATTSPDSTVTNIPSYSPPSTPVSTPLTPLSTTVTPPVSVYPTVTTVAPPLNTTATPPPVTTPTSPVVTTAPPTVSVSPTITTVAPSLSTTVTPPQVKSVAPSAVTQTANEEIVRRQESQIVAQQFIREGIKLYYDAKYNEAIAKLEQALKLLPRAPATEIDYNRSIRCLSESYYRLADAAYRAKDTAKARELAKKSLAYLPDNRAAENIIVKIKMSEQETAGQASYLAREKHTEPTTPPPPKLDATPEFKAKQDDISKLFREARILYSSGQFDEAELRYKQILLIDHYNEDAYKDLQDVNDSRQEIIEEGVDASRRRRLWEVSETWLPKITTEIKPPEKTDKTADINVSSVAKQKIEEKLRKIVFPEVSFREAAISDVVKFLSDESRKYDPEGVNIVLGSSLVSAAPAPTIPAPVAPEALPGVAPAPAPSAPASGRPITLSLHNIPMIEVLKYVTSLAALKMRVDANAVVILPLDTVEGGELVTRTYNVSPDAIRSLLSTSSGAAPVAPPATTPGGGFGTTGAIGGTAPGSTELKQFFTDAGVPFPPGASLTYLERARTLYVRNTVENMEIFERVLSTFNVVPSQVEIESKFVEINQTDLDELGFQWQVGPFTVGQSGQGQPWTIDGGGISTGGQTNTWLTQGLRGAASIKGDPISALLFGAAGSTTGPNDALANFGGIIDNTAMGVIINALNQKTSSDVLSAPKVTTISGAQAQIRVVQEFIYPTEYSIPTAAAGTSSGTGGGSAVVTPSIPSGWKTREVGVILNVTPTVNADGYTINMTLVPEVSAFLGMLDYSPPAPPAGSAVPPMKIVQPLFETRNLTTSVVIWDGQSVVLGGLIKEVVTKQDDKLPFFGDIPFVGRLFRSKVNSRSKRNLLIFVTARLVDPAGNLLHKQEKSAPAIRE